MLSKTNPKGDEQMKSEFHPFMLERDMSIWENQVEYNISESGVHPLTMGEIIEHAPNKVEELLSTELGYPQTNGSIELRDRIAACYPGATRDNVVVTTGAAGANFTTMLTVLDPGDEILFMLPNYMQIWGIAKNFGMQVKTFSLREELGWGFDTDEFSRALSDNTKLIAICNPNNPTGHIMTAEERKTVIAGASRVGAWILTDEVYAGAEHYTDEITPSFWGDYDRVLAMGSLSKAYALPGLRIGWVVAPPETAEEIWSRQDYVTICSTMLGNKLAAYALAPEVRQWIIERTRKYVRRGYGNFARWVEKRPDMFSMVPPQAAAIAFVRYHREVNSSELVQHLIHEKSTYVVAGDFFGLDHYLRISYGLPDDYVNEGLDRLLQVLDSMD
jgi:aspartate/methionine/tyrosine aminotransferase